MNREIVFRAWNKIEKRYQIISELSFGPNKDGGLMVYSVGVEDDVGRVHWEDVPNTIILEQWTGLKDKNGKNIYEGDWVGLADECWTGIPTEVKWDEDEIGWHPFCNGGCGLCMKFTNTPDEMIVVGNIRENPTLLEDAKRKLQRRQFFWNRKLMKGEK